MKSAEQTVEISDFVILRGEAVTQLSRIFDGAAISYLRISVDSI